MSKYYKVHEYDGDPRWKNGLANPQVADFNSPTLKGIHNRLESASDAKDCLIFRIYSGRANRPGAFYIAQEAMLWELEELNLKFADRTKGTESVARG